MHPQERYSPIDAGGTPGCADRRRRPVGRRRRLPPQTSAPGKTYAILEARDAIGGTWDLFRYPGIRSDSDMFTLGYDFRPWEEGKAIADGPSIRSYIRDDGARPRRRAAHPLRPPVVGAEWSSADARWTVEAERTDTGETVQLTCSFLYGCTGYYRYDEGYRREFEGSERFAGPIVHPQHWPDDLDYDGKRVVVIGSGATAVTLVPAMAERAAHVTMLQRSPSYVVTLPAEDPLVEPRSDAGCPRRPRTRWSRWKNVLLPMATFNLSRERPEFMKKVHPQGRAEAPTGRLRGRHPLQAALQPVGAAALPGAGQRPVRGDLSRAARLS